MFREMLQGKLHRATVTACRLEYNGSLTVDLDLMERAGMREFQKIQVLNCNNGYRLETYLIAGERGSGEIVVNGAAARHAYPGDIVIVAAFAFYTDAEIATYKPQVLVLDGKNRVVG
jgi:aspartate 1-decarboxylase